MKNSRVLIWGLMIFLLAGLPLGGICQSSGNGQLLITADILWEYAHTLMDKQDYTTAQVELKRFAHFFPSDERINQARLDTGLCLFHTGQYLEAARICNHIMLEYSDRPEAQNACFLQSLCFEKMGNPGYAQLVLHNYLKLVQAEKIADQRIQDRIYFHLGRLSLARGVETLALEDFEKAESFFLQVSLQGTKKYPVGKYLGAIATANDFPRKNPGIGGALSLIPGAGFLYTHRFHDALAALVVNGGFMAAACKAWDQDNKALSGILALVGSGFYTGSIYGSISAVHKYNQRGVSALVDGQVSLSPIIGDKEYGVMLRMPF